MGHHFVQENEDHHVLTMVYVGYTATVTYPVIRVLAKEKLKKLVSLLGSQNEGVLTRLCYDLLNTKSYIAYDGGVIAKERISLEPVEMRGSKGLFDIPSKYKQGAEQSATSIDAFAGDEVQQISISTTLELFIVYTNPAIDECIGIIRTPFAGLPELGGICRMEQGFTQFQN